ncbi:uncharacterized protein KD926_000916 [Aspergillus affinis]|uniref:uncharacterized protein n=1 Tax=Aspergillus affinis TaxID=1070780 RepID=UPI0022FE1B5B|nr:uncharacterized protein KD926_000916 [Aspergillus affinis]KAI9037049.1 hypothetical protein KD926_000916 [Aspergillus affinis]
MAAAMDQQLPISTPLRSPRIPIAQLSPTADNLQGSAIHAVVALLWPYSSSTKSLSLLLSEPDFRLRRSNGQVKVIFHGPVAEEVAKSKIGIGDDVCLDLAGSRLASNQAAVQTPGKCVAWDVHFDDRVLLEVSRSSTPLSTIRVEPSSSQTNGLDPATTAPTTPPRNNLNKRGITDDAEDSGSWQTPVFTGKSRASFGGLVDSAYDPFTEEDGYVPGKGRKRPRYSMQHSDWRLVDEPESPGDKDFPVDWTHIFDEDWGEGSEPDEDKETSTEKLPEAPGDGADQKSPSDVAEAAEGDTSTPEVSTEPIKSPKPVEADDLFVHPGSIQKPVLPRQAFGQGFLDFSSHLPTDTPRLHPIPSPGLPIPSPLVTASSNQQSYFMPITDMVQPNATTVSTSLSQEIQGTEEEASKHVDAMVETESLATSSCEAKARPLSTRQDNKAIASTPSMTATAADDQVAEVASTAIDYVLQDRMPHVISTESIVETAVDLSKAGHPGEAKADKVDEHGHDLSDDEDRLRENSETHETTEHHEAEAFEDDAVEEDYPDDKHVEDNDIVETDVRKDGMDRDYAEDSMENYDSDEDEPVEDNGHKQPIGQSFVSEETRVGDKPGTQEYSLNELAESHRSVDEERTNGYENEEGDDDEEEDEVGEIDDWDEDEEDEEEEGLYGRYEEDDESESQSDMVDDDSPTQHQPAPKNSQPEVIVLDSDSEDEAPPNPRTDDVASRTGEITSEQEPVSSPSLGSQRSSSEDSVDSENEKWPEDEDRMDIENADDDQPKQEKSKIPPPERMSDDLSKNEPLGAQAVEEDYPEEEMSGDEELPDDATNLKAASHGSQDDKQLESDWAEDDVEDEEMKDRDESDQQSNESESESGSQSESESDEDDVVLLDQTDYGRRNEQWAENQQLDNEPTQSEQKLVEQAPEQMENTERMTLSTSVADYEYSDDGDATYHESYEQHDVIASPQVPEQDSLHHDFRSTHTTEETHNDDGFASHAHELAIDPELYNSGPGRGEAVGDIYQTDKQYNRVSETPEAITVPRSEIDYSLMLDGAASPRIPASIVSERQGSASQSQRMETPGSTPVVEIYRQSLPAPAAAESLPTPEPTQERNSQLNGKPPSTHAEFSTPQPLGEDLVEVDSEIEASSVEESREGSHDIGEPLESHTPDEDQSHQADFAFDHDARNALDDINFADVDRHYPGLRSKLSYFAPLATLVDHYNALIDTISAVTEVRPVVRASAGKKDYMLTVQLTDPSMAGTTQFAQILRPFKAALPSVSEGDAILLRNFKVKSFNRSMMLVSTSTSAWAVFDGQNKTRVEGPPVEYRKEEQTYATDMRQWYQEDGMAMVADAQLQASIEKAGREGTPASSVALSDSGSIDSTQRVGERGESSVSNLSSRRNRKSHRRITIHELRDGRRYTEVGSPSGKESIHELRDGTVYANL